MKKALLLFGITSAALIFLTAQRIGATTSASESSPFQVIFETGKGGMLKESLPVTVRVERNPNKPQISLNSQAHMEVLLRVPSGVRLMSEGWKPVPLPEAEKKEERGVWSLFEKAAPVTADKSVGHLPLALSVVEEGVNWVITARVRIIQGKETWQTFGVLFATARKGIVEFHGKPKMDFEQVDAQANRS